MSLVNRFSGKTKDGRLVQYGYTAHVGNYLIYLSHRSRSEHFHRLKNAWAISAAVFDWLRASHVNYLVIDVKNDGKYYTPTMVMAKNATKGQYDGWDEQYFLNESYWQGVPEVGIRRISSS